MFYRVSAPTFKTFNGYHLYLQKEGHKVHCWGGKSIFLEVPQGMPDQWYASDAMPLDPFCRFCGITTSQGTREVLLERI